MLLHFMFLINSECVHLKESQADQKTLTLFTDLFTGDILVFQ